MKLSLPLGDQVVILSFSDFDEELDVDSITSIDYSNLFGEAVTVSALLNKVGLLKAEAESIYQIKKFEMEVYAANLSKRFRREANISEGGKFSIVDEGITISLKLTEGSIESAILVDKVYQNHRKAVIESQKNLAFIDSLFWSIKSKDSKLSVLMKGTTPEEFVKELVEGKVNGFIIKKQKYQS